MKTINFLRKVLKVVLVAVVSFGITLGSVPQNLYAVEVANEEVRYALDELNRNSYWDWQVVVDEYAGMPKTLYGSLTNQYEGEQLEVAQKFLSHYIYSTNIFGIENNLFDYKMVNVINSIGTYILYVQTYNNIPIEHSYLLISVTPQKSISLAKSRTFIHLDINTNPQLGEAEAYNIALDNAKEIIDIAEPGITELVIFPNKEAIQIAWKVQFKTDEFGGMIEYIISDSGEILEKINHEGNPHPQDLPGNGNPILNQEDVINVLNSLGNNIGLIDETKNLVDIMSMLEYDDYKQIVSESLITSVLNIFNNPQNLPLYIEILKNRNFITEEAYNQFLAKIQEVSQQALPEKEQEIQEPQTKTLILNNDAPLILVDTKPLVQILPNPDEGNADALIPQTESENIPDTTTVQTPNEPSPDSNTNIEQTIDTDIPPRIPAPAPSIGSGSFTNNVPPDTTNPVVEPVMAKTPETEESVQKETVPVLTQEQIDQMQAAMEETIRNTAIVSAAQDEAARAKEEENTTDINTVIELQPEPISEYNALVSEISSGPKPIRYIVQAGDTAENIALYYGVSASQIGGVSAGQELYFPVEGVRGQDTLEQALSDLNNMGVILSQVQSEAQTANQDVLGLYMIELNAAQLCYESLLLHVDAIRDQINMTSNITNSIHDTPATPIQNLDSGDSTTSISTDQTTSNTEDQSSTTTNPAYYGHAPYPQTTQTTDTTGDITDFLDDPSPSSSDGAAATGSLSGYDSDGAAATGGLSGYNSGDGAGATGTLTGYYIPPSGYTTTSSSSSSQGSGATGGISGYDYTPGSNLIAQSETCDGSGGSSGGTGTTGGVSG